MFVDGEELLSDPTSVMDQVQHFLDLHTILDYTKILRFVLSATCSLCPVHVCMCVWVCTWGCVLLICMSVHVCLGVYVGVCTSNM